MAIISAATVGAAAGISDAARLLVKPFNDLYESAKQKINGISERWDRIAEIEAAYEKLASVQFVNTITSHGQVSLMKFYYAPKLLLGNTDKQKKTIAYLNEISDTKNTLILGTAGQGKSTFLRYLCFKELEFAKRIPILVELRDVDEKTNLRELLIQNLSFLGVREMNDELLAFFLDSGKFVFFLDGFDEVKREVSHATQVSIKTLVSTHSNTRWIISSRPGSLGDHLTAIPDLLVARIAPLTPDDFEPFLERLGVGEKAKDNLLLAIKSSSTAIQNVLTTPLMLTLLNSTFGTCTLIPKTLHEFYENMFHVLVSRHDDTKPFYLRQKATTLTNADLQAAFSAFSFLSKEYSVSLTDEQFSTCAKGAAKLTGLTFTAEGLKIDLTDSICLMVRDGLKTAFLHKSIQEFFSAYFLKSLGEPEKASKIYEKIRLKTWPNWQQELRFLEQIDRYRFIENYKIPSIIEFLSAIGYEESARHKLTKKNFDSYIKRLEVYRLDSDDKFLSNLILLVCEDKSVTCMFDEFVKYADKDGHPVDISKEDLDTIFSGTAPIFDKRFKRVRLDRYLRNTPKLLSSYFIKLKDFSQKIEKDRTRLSKILLERDQNFRDLLGI